MIGSPGTGRQHLARRIITSSTPSTRMPYWLAVAVGWRRRRVPGTSVSGGGSVSGRLALLEALEDLVDDDLRRDLRAAERDVELLGLAKAHLADDVRQQRAARDLLRRQARLAQVLLQQLAARVLGVLARLGLEPLLDLVARPRRLDHGQPVARRAALAL